MYLNVGVFKCYIKMLLIINSENAIASYNRIYSICYWNVNIRPLVNQVMNNNKNAVPKHHLWLSIA
jgi:hypothetical protein